MEINENRRSFLKTFPAILASPILQNIDNFKIWGNLSISCNSYDWVTFFGRENKNWGENWDKSIEEFAKTGMKALEPSINSVEEAKIIWTALKKYKVSMPSVYIGSVLHRAEESAKNIENIILIAKTVKTFGTLIIVTNPNPISWGGSELKTDAELIVQAKNMNKLGYELRKIGITLAYHTHDVELKAGAREFHHVLQNTNPQNVQFCMDVHWIYRGSDNSQVAVFDVLKMYGNRIVELHLRQSQNGIWSETFGDGDIDYPRFAKELKRLNIRPHLVIEQCVESKSPNTMTSVEAHIIDLEVVRNIFY
jgi:inosose dehydratase